MVTTSIGPNGFVVLPGMAWPKSADNTLRAGSRSISKGDCRRGSTTTRKARRGRLPRWSSARCVSWAVREMDRARPRRNTGSRRRVQEVADRRILTTYRSKTGFRESVHFGLGFCFFSDVFCLFLSRRANRVGRRPKGSAHKDTARSACHVRLAPL